MELLRKHASQFVAQLLRDRIHRPTRPSLSTNAAHGQMGCGIDSVGDVHANARIDRPPFSTGSMLARSNHSLSILHLTFWRRARDTRLRFGSHSR